MTEAYKYEVAFSFLQIDECLALEIADRIRDRVSVGVFVYSERQNDLAGTDGVETFSKAFSEESRIVVILYREGWGQTPWTRVEETAIRGRGFYEGHEFLLLVKLDQTKAPLWIPSTRIYLSFERFGIDGVAGAVESRVQSSGGRVRAETVLDRAALAAREIDFRTERSQWRRSIQAVESAIREVNVLFDELKRHAEEVSAQIQQIQIHCNKSGKKSCEVWSGASGFSVRWYNNDSDALEQSRLVIETWRTDPINAGVVLRTQKYSVEYDFDLDTTRHVGWRESSDHRFFTTSQLAEYWIKKLLEWRTEIPVELS